MSEKPKRTLTAEQKAKMQEGRRRAAEERKKLLVHVAPVKEIAPTKKTKKEMSREVELKRIAAKEAREAYQQAKKERALM